MIYLQAVVGVVVDMEIGVKVANQQLTTYHFSPLSLSLSPIFGFMNIRGKLIV